MIYVFDTSSYRELQHFYPTVFKSIWSTLNSLVADGSIVSTKEVLREATNSNIGDDVLAWCKLNSNMFSTPNPTELNFVSEILSIPHFQTLISKQSQLRGTTVADPFVIAKAQSLNATVVSQERPKPNSSKIPNVCAHFNIHCITLEGFMQALRWSF